MNIEQLERAGAALADLKAAEERREKMVDYGKDFMDHDSLSLTADERSAAYFGLCAYLDAEVEKARQQLRNLGVEA